MKEEAKNEVITLLFPASLQDMNSLEPTLQAALLPKTTFGLLLEVSKKYENGMLKGMKPQKPSRKKSLELTQNQASILLEYYQCSSVVFELNYEFF